MVWVWVILVLLILFVPAIPYGLRSAYPYFRTTPATVTDRATLLLALGTFALANAALLQAVSSERARRYQMTPGAELLAAVSDASVGIPMGAGDRAVYRPPAGSLAPYVTNHGPGVILQSQVRFAVGLTSRPNLAAYSRWPLFSERYQDHDLRVDSAPIAVGTNRRVHIFEEIVRSGHSMAFVSDDPEIVTQFIAECRCLDAEGRPGKSAFLGLQRTIPSQAAANVPADAVPMSHDYDYWTVMENADVEFLLLNLAGSMRWGVPRPLRVGRKHPAEPPPVEHREDQTKIR